MPHPTDLPEREDSTRCTNEERRASRRRPANVRVRCMPFKTGDSPPIWTAQVRDVSRLGIGLILPHPAGPGTLIEIELTQKSGALVRNVLARVVHQERESSKTYVVGCAFVTELEDRDLGAFQAGAVRPSGPDCRRWTRFPCNVETVCTTCETAPGERRSGRILNISAGGIGLLLRCQFSEGTLLHFELPPEMNLAHSKILVRVVRVLEHGEGNWFLGCEFAERLHEDDLQALLR
jgi:hypothetical protein